MPTTERTTRLKNRCRFKHVAGGKYVDAGFDLRHAYMKTWYSQDTIIARTEQDLAAG